MHGQIVRSGEEQFRPFVIVGDIQQRSRSYFIEDDVLKSLQGKPVRRAIISLFILKDLEFGDYFVFSVETACWKG